MDIMNKSASIDPRGTSASIDLAPSRISLVVTFRTPE